MTKPLLTIHNAQTGEILEREMNASEFLQYKKDQEDLAAIKTAEDEKAAKRSALLEKLGITEEEAKVLLG